MWHFGTVSVFRVLPIILLSTVLVVIVTGNSVIVESIKNVQNSGNGFVAEWEYHEGLPDKGQTSSGVDSFDNLHSSRNLDQHLRSPPNRGSSAAWQDAVGSWWLFGERINTSTSNQKFLSDLWVYEKSERLDSVGKFRWKSIFSSDKLDNTNQVSSSVPENIQSPIPILCGSNTRENIAVFGSSSRTSESSFVEDNLVWVYNIPKSNSKSMGRTSSNTNGDEGVWTSYICCDLCEPDLPTEKNTTTALDFCPHFSETFPVFEDDTDSKSTTKERSDQITAGTRIEPILWCAQDSLMALQLTFAKSRNSVSQPLLFLEAKNTGSTSSKKLSNESSRSTNEQEIKSEAPTKIHLSKSNGTDLPRSKFSSKTTTSFNFSAESQRAFQQSEIGSVHPEISSKDRSNSLKETQNYLNWWKFNLVTTEWEKMPQVITFKGSSSFEVQQLRQLFDAESCRTTTDSVFVYILCLPIDSKNEASTIRNVFVFDPIKSTIEALPTSEQLRLNVCFEESELWKPTNSILHTLRIPESGQTIILLAYNKLIDFWVHEHLKNTIVSVENLWKGTTLDNFQHHSTFYKLKIQVGNSNEFHHVFLPNPRNYKTGLFNFNDTNPDGWFHIKIESDEHVFLPSRDTSFMINVEDEQVNSAKVSLPTPVQSFLKVEPQEFPNDKRETQLDSHLAETDNKTTSFQNNVVVDGIHVNVKSGPEATWNSPDPDGSKSMVNNASNQGQSKIKSPMLSKSKPVIPSMFGNQKKLASIFNEWTNKILVKDSLSDVSQNVKAENASRIRENNQAGQQPLSTGIFGNQPPEVNITFTTGSDFQPKEKLFTDQAANISQNQLPNANSVDINTNSDGGVTQAVTNNYEDTTNQLRILHVNSSRPSLIMNSLVDYSKSDIKVDVEDSVNSVELGDLEQSKDANDYENFSIIDSNSLLSENVSSVNSVFFYALSLSIFATIGIVFFVKSCMKCPSQREKDESSTPPAVAPSSMTYSATSAQEDFYLDTPNI